jgi:hypothetical protein
MTMTFAFDRLPGGGFDPALPDRRSQLRIAAGIALSLAAHALLLAIQRHPAAPPRPTAQAAPLTIRLRAPAPPAPPVPLPADVTPPRQAAPPGPAPRARKPLRTAPPVIAVAPEQRQSAEETYAVTPAPAPDQAAPAPAAPRFDMHAALKTARRVADEPDPAKAGTALERLPPPPLQTENKFERAIKAAKRPDCKDGVPGGLFAPLFLAMDKKDGGCKW